jgi:hypothetical protein
MGVESVLPAVPACTSVYLNNSFPVIVTLVFVTFDLYLTYPTSHQRNVKVVTRWTIALQNYLQAILTLSFIA